MSKAYVYLFVYPTLHEFKIGISNSISRRAFEINRWLDYMPSPLSSWAIKLELRDARQIEKGLHKLLSQFSSKRTSGDGRSEFFSDKGLYFAKQIFRLIEANISGCKIEAEIDLNCREEIVADNVMALDELTYESQLNKYQRDVIQVKRFIRLVFYLIGKNKSISSFFFTAREGKFYVIINQSENFDTNLASKVKKFVNIIRRKMPGRWVGSCYRSGAINNYELITNNEVGSLQALFYDVGNASISHCLKEVSEHFPDVKLAKFSHI